MKMLMLNAIYLYDDLSWKIYFDVVTNKFIMLESNIFL